jgi:hypothetical protein
LTSWKNDKWNVIWIYNLKKEYETDEIIKIYLEKVRKWEILYDPNMIKNIYIRK